MHETLKTKNKISVISVNTIMIIKLSVFAT